MERHWWCLESDAVVKALKSDSDGGLSGDEANKRLSNYGENRLEQSAKISPWRIFFSQFTDFMVLVLLGAAGLSAVLGEVTDSIVILSIIILNAILGLVQEYRAERSLAALKQLSAPQSRVIRGNHVIHLDNRWVVPGDILILEAGDRIGADARLIRADALEVDESALTGESLAVAKSSQSLTRRELPLGDRRCMVYAGTTVSQGRGKAVVVSTGMATELGQIAHLLQTAESTETPLQQRLEQLGRWLVYICLFVCAAVATLGTLRGEPFRIMFLSGVSLAVAAIPEGLPAIVTISLAIGVQQMIRRHVLIRRLPAVETLGCATAICSDKTGTITQNRMMVTELYAGGETWRVQGEGYRPKGEISHHSGKKWSIQRNQGYTHFISALALCNNAALERTDQGEWVIQGDPTEGALLTLAAKSGYDLNQNTLKRKAEVPFSSERRRMSVAVSGKGETLLYTKGSTDKLLNLSNQIYIGDEVGLLTSTERRHIEEKAEKMAESALRVLAVAFRPLRAEEKNITEQEEKGLIFLGLVGMKDPPRPEVSDAIHRCHRAGIRTIMITGDHPATARAIAREIGLTSKDRIVTGIELEAMNDKDLKRTVSQVDIYARVSPQHKLRLVRALKNDGEVVAMTGDGVNDAPAVKEANIGVAMGIAGTDVTKEASAMVITDDNFASIVAAVEEGRGIYENIRKSIRYLLGCNIGEVLTMFGATLLGLPLPLTPLQILWTNLVTDGLPAIALSMDPADKGLMNMPPRSPKEGVFGRGLGKRLLLQGIAIGGVTLGVFYLTLEMTRDIVAARTMAYASLVFSQLSYVFVCRSEHKPLWKTSLKGNPFLWAAVGISGLMQLLTMYLPAMQRLFSTISLTGGQWLWIVLCALCAIIVSEGVTGSHRAIKRRRRFANV